MKCSVCNEALGSAAYTIDLLIGDDHCTLNMHQRCMRGLVGNAATNALNTLVLKVGWTQLALPEVEQRRA